MNSYDENNFPMSVSAEVVFDPNTIYPPTPLSEGDHIEHNATKILPQHANGIKIRFLNKGGDKALDEDMLLSCQHPDVQAICDRLEKDIFAPQEVVAPLPVIPPANSPAIPLATPLMNVYNQPLYVSPPIPLSPIPLMSMYSNLLPPPTWASLHPYVVKQNYLQILLNREKDTLTYKHIVMLFAILSLTGVAFERAYKTVLNGVTKDFIDAYSSKDCLRWIERLPIDNVLHWGDDMVSLYAFITKQSLASSIECLHRHLCAHEHENSFAATDKKSHWVFENTPLFYLELPLAYKTIFEAFNTHPVYKSSTYPPSRFEVSFKLKGVKSFTLDFSLMKSTKSSESRWFQKSEQTPPSVAQQSPHALPEATPIIKPGDKIPGSDIERKKLLSPIIESGMIVWIYGPEKSFKSRFGRVLAHSLSHGSIFLNKYTPSEPVPVLFISGEDLPDKFQCACEAELRGANLPVEIKFSLLLAKDPSNTSGQIDILAPRWKALIEKAIVTQDVIILDCLYSLTTNKVSIAELIAYTTPWKNKGKTFIIIDHTNREGELQGSIDKVRIADMCIKLEKNENDTITLSFPTTRHLGPDDSLPLLLRPKFGTDGTFKFEIYEGEPPQISNKTKCKMIAYILHEDYHLKQQDEIDNLFEVSNSSISNWVKECRGTTWAPHEKKLYENYKAMSCEALKEEAKKLK